MAVGRRIAAGELIAGYEVGALVGRGGMGEVYRALDLHLERPVALKLLSERLSDDGGFRERMLRESRLAASLDHPNVVPIYEAGEADGRLFIAMRYVDGADLKALLRHGGAVPPERAVAIAAQVADALDAAHARGSSTATSSRPTSCWTGRAAATMRTWPTSGSRRALVMRALPTDS